VNAKDNVAGYAPLFIAGLNDVAEMLIARGTDVNVRGKREDTSLHRAARHGYKERIELLVAKGADVNAKDDRGRTPLQLAEDKGHTEIAELLRKHGAKE